MIFLIGISEKPSTPRGPIEISGMSDNSLTLTWIASESDGGSRITDYVVEVKETNKKAWRIIGNTIGNVTNIQLEDLIKDQAYDFRISAKNKIGTSEPLATDESIIMGQKKSKFYKKNEEFEINIFIDNNLSEIEHIIILFLNNYPYFIFFAFALTFL